MPAWTLPICTLSPSREIAGKSILIMNFHPSASIAPPGPTTAEPFAPAALYELRIDTNGDAVADITYQVRVSSSKDGGQTATLRRFEGAQPIGKSDGGRVLAEGVPVSTGREARVTEAGDHRIFVGRRSDPFFFDVLGVLQELQVHGRRFLRRQGHLQRRLGSSQRGAGVERGQPVGPHADPDGRRGRAAGCKRIAARGPHKLPSSPARQNDAYRAGEPAEDGRFVAVFAHALEHTGGYAPEAAKRAAQTLLPDMMRYDPTRPASYPQSGRTLSDDVVDGFLTILTNGKVKGDGIGPHGDLLAEFPYLGPPHGDVALGRLRRTGTGVVNEQRTNRTEELRDAPAGGVHRGAFPHRRRHRPIGFASTKRSSAVAF